MASITPPSEDMVRPVVLHTEDIEGKEIESFPDSRHGTVSWKTLISSPKTPTDTFTIGIGTCHPGSSTSCPTAQNEATSTTTAAAAAAGRLSLHRHSHAEFYHVISGKGLVTIDGVEYKVKKGSVVFIPGNAEHGIVNIGHGEKDDQEDLVWLYAFAADSFAQIVYRFSESPQDEKTEK